MEDRIQTRTYDLASIVQSQSPEQRDKVIDIISEAVADEVMISRGGNLYVKKPPRLVMFVENGKSRLARAIEQGNHVI